MGKMGFVCLFKQFLLGLGLRRIREYFLCKIQRSFEKGDKLTKYMGENWMSLDRKRTQTRERPGRIHK